ncbi:MAG TPA: hypothetical protein VFU26_05560 [Gaiellaceae bacterium]|nr:hypothetical protein [Gaiellaceae bacterium]
MNFPLSAVRELVSSVQKDGRPVVRLSCADYGNEWVVAADVYPVDELTVEPRSAGPYVFDSAQEARNFVESSLVALQLLGCEVA